MPTAGTPDDTGTAVRYAAGIDGNLALGVVDRYLFGARGDGLVTTPLWGLYVEPRWLYAKVGPNKTENEFYLRAVGFLYPRERYYGFVVGLAERSFRRKYDHRLTGGAGVGTNLVRTKDAALLAAQGLAFERSDFYTAMFEGRPEEMSQIRNIVRAVTRIAGRVKLADKTSVFFDLYVKPSVTHPIIDYRILSKLSLELAVAGRVTARALLDYTRETVVAAGTAKDELVLSFGIAIRKD
jgi:hypothetical protein